MQDFRHLRVSRKQAQTDEAAVVYLERPDGNAGDFRFEAGQYLTLEVEVRGVRERRAYSMCTAPHDEEFGFCVKRLEGGKVSNYLLDTLRAGDELAVMPPDGRFKVATAPDAQRTYYLIGAGSGITPLMSIAREVLERESASEVHLLYGNRSEDTIIFRRELDQLAANYAGQFSVEHVLSQPKRESAGGLKGLFGKKKAPEWEGRVGRVDPQALGEWLAAHPARAPQSDYYICGPGGMIDTIEKDLLRRGVEADRIHTERFVVEAPADKIAGAADNTVTVTLDGAEHVITVPSDKTILETLVAQGQTPPYSCTSGACSTCIAKVTEGEVRMDVNHALDPSEVEEGYCLTCQAHPVTSAVALTYDE